MEIAIPNRFKDFAEHYKSERWAGKKAGAKWGEKPDKEVGQIAAPCRHCPHFHCIPHMDGIGDPLGSHFRFRIQLYYYQPVVIAEIISKQIILIKWT